MGGLILGSFYLANADFAAKVPIDKPDLLIPVFMTHYLPHGIIGIIVVAILSAAMSSLSSTLNSLSAVTMEDFIARKKQIEPHRYIVLSKAIAAIWGIATIVMAFFVGNIAKTVIEAINKIGSLFYGPVIAMFVMGFYMRKVSAISANTGVIAGVLFNMILWLFFPNVFWFWWNIIGAVVTVSISSLLTYLFGLKQKEASIAEPTPIRFFSRETFVLLLFFLLILLFCVLFPKLF
jgi:Na+/proline symporter